MIAKMRMAKKTRSAIWRRGTMALRIDLRTTCRPVHNNNNKLYYFIFFCFFFDFFFYCTIYRYIFLIYLLFLLFYQPTTLILFINQSQASSNISYLQRPSYCHHHIPHSPLSFLHQTFDLKYLTPTSIPLQITFAFSPNLMPHH